MKLKIKKLPIKIPYLLREKSNEYGIFLNYYKNRD